jgi:hypothetical protein
MSTLRVLSLRLIDLLTLLDESVQQVPDQYKGPVLSRFCTILKQEHNIPQADIDEGVRMLIFKDDCKRGFVAPGGVVRRKEIIATRTVPISHPEEMGENGLMWRDVRR